MNTNTLVVTNADWFIDALQKQGDKAPNPWLEVPQKAHQAGQAPLQTRQKDRVHLRASEGQATSDSPIRQDLKGHPVRRRLRRYRHVLAMKREQVLTLELK